MTQTSRSKQRDRRKKVEKALEEGGETCYERLQRFKNSSDHSIPLLEKTLDEVLEGVAGTLFFAATFFLENEWKSGNIDFYFWPGYVSERINRRFTLHYPDGGRKVSCGAGFRSSNGIAFPTYKESNATRWFDCVLSSEHADTFVWDRTAEGTFFPGGTHAWIMQDVSPPKLKNVNGEDDESLEVLAIGLRDSTNTPLTKNDGMLSIRLDAENCHTWGSNLASVLNGNEHLAPNVMPLTDLFGASNTFINNLRYRWPHSQDHTVIPEAMNAVNVEALAQHIQDIRESLYSMWVASCFDSKWHIKHRGWIDEFLSHLRGSSAITIQAVADRIASEVNRATDRTNGQDDHEYRFWYTIAVRKAIEGELGSAMILCSHELPAAYLKLVRPWIFDVYQAMRMTEHKVRAELGEQPRASDINGAEWNILRTRVCGILKSVGENKLDRLTFDWAHHVKGGGNEDSAGEFTRTFNTEVCSELRFDDRIKSFPPHEWEPNSLSPSDSGELSPSWERPPLRAIAQFDWHGHDLRNAFMLIRAGAEQVLAGAPIPIRLRFHSDVASVEHSNPHILLLHDYLWFNVSTIGYGLIKFAEGFSGEVGKLQKKQIADGLAGQSAVGICSGGRIDWLVCEHRSGVKITVAHYWKMEFKVRADAATEECDVIFPFVEPSLKTPTGSPAEAYEYFIKSGGKYCVKEGILQIVIPANVFHKEGHNEYWEVALCP